MFNLMYMHEGTGLGMSFRDVMELEAVHKDRLLSRLRDQLESKRSADQAALAAARKR